MQARVLLFTLLFSTPLMARADERIELLKQRNCPDCRLADVDLMHVDLREASLRSADLRGSKLYGTELRQTKLNDLS